MMNLKKYDKNLQFVPSAFYEDYSGKNLNA